LETALRDAKTLLAYAAESGTDLAPADFSAVVEIEAKYVSGAYTPADETNFWIAYNKLAKALEHVSVTSLDATEPVELPERKVWGIVVQERSNSSASHQAVKRYTRITSARE